MLKDEHQLITMILKLFSRSKGMDWVKQRRKHTRFLWRTRKKERALGGAQTPPLSILFLHFGVTFVCWFLKQRGAEFTLTNTLDKIPLKLG
jgi:hypothetical protein